VAARGADIYRQECRACHGETGDGDGPAGRALDPAPTNFRDPAWSRSATPLEAYAAVTNGVPDTAMLAWDIALEPEERWDVAFHVWSLAGSAGERELGWRSYDTRCAACHGDLAQGGSGPALGRPDLASESRAGLEQRIDRVHPDVTARMSGTQIRAIAEWMMTLVYDPGTEPAGGRAP
jgi:mono/diheme cytochrome c family protein